MEQMKARLVWRRRSELKVSLSPVAALEVTRSPFSDFAKFEKINNASPHICDRTDAHATHFYSFDEIIKCPQKIFFNSFEFFLKTSKKVRRKYRKTVAQQEMEIFRK